MNLFYIARKNLSDKPLQTTLSIILLAFGVGMSSLMILTENQIQDQFDRNLKDIEDCVEIMEKSKFTVNNLIYVNDNVVQCFPKSFEISLSLYEGSNLTKISIS